MISCRSAHSRCGAASGPPSFALPGTQPKYERSRPFKLTHLELELELDLEERALSGVARLHAERISELSTSLSLDAVGFALDAVEIVEAGQARPAQHSYDGETLEVEVDAKLAQVELVVTYRAKPKRGLYFLAPDSRVKRRPLQVWSQCQDEDARHFFPCHDKPHAKMTFALAVTVPNGMLALSNGEPQEQHTPRHGPWRYRFSMKDPLPSYLVTLVVGHFSVVEDRPALLGEGGSQRAVPITYFVPEGSEKAARRSLGETPRMVELFSRLLAADFPFSRYSQVVVSDFIFGGMENTTATTLYEHVLLDEKAAVDTTSNDLVAHELAHHWFGDWLTCRDWTHAWLNEGFATYFEHIEREDRLGRDEYEQGITQDLEAYLAEAGGRYARPIVCRQYEAPIDLFDRHLYEKGALVLHMLRQRLGASVFWRGVQRYVHTHRGGIVETRDLMRALEEVSGQSLDRFFDEWVLQAGHPVLKVKVAYEGGLLLLNVKQTQGKSLFELPVEVLVRRADGQEERHRKLIVNAEDTVTVALSERPQFVVFDPELAITCGVSFSAPGDMLREQLRSAPTARARSVAAAALAEQGDLPGLEALTATLKNEQEAWMVRVAAAQALGRLRGSDALAQLLAAADTPHPKVRRAVVAALGYFRQAEVGEPLWRLAKEGGSYLVEAEAARALGRARKPGARKHLLRLLERESWADVVRAGALDGLALLQDESVVDTLIEQTEYGHPNRGRRAAILALAQISESQKVRRHLESLLEDNDPHLRIDVVRALQRLAHPSSRAALRASLEREKDGRAARRMREALRELGAASKLVAGEELELLRSELSEVKARLLKLEGQRAAKEATRGTAKAAPQPTEAARAPRQARAQKKARAATNTKKAGKPEAKASQPGAPSARPAKKAATKATPSPNPTRPQAKPKARSRR